MEKSRTQMSMRNAQIALFFYCINLVLTFFSRKYFIEYLGSEVLGLNTTAVNLLSFLNLAELGIGTAISYTLYKPIHNNDTRSINEIVSVQGWLYRKIAFGVIIGACILMCFFPLIFKKPPLPLWYAYGSFGVLLISSLLSYFVNYRQIVLSASQQEYKITLNVQGFKCIKVILQILAIVYLNNGYLFWLLLELVFAILTSWGLNITIRKNYPWLQPSISLGKILRKQYPQIITKTKQLFFHKIAQFALGQTSPLIIYAYTSLTLVAIYGNYMFIITGITALSSAILNNITAGVGNLVAEGDKKRIKSVFWEITSFRVWIASVFCFCIYQLADSFIILWVGEKYLLEQSAFIVLLIYTFIVLTRTNDTFLAAYGLYRDIWAPIVEAVLNISCSIILGYFFGLTGIISGIVISLLLIVCMWKPYFLYKEGFKESISEYIIRHFKYTVLIATSFFLSNYIIRHICVSIFSFFEWGKIALMILLLYISISAILFTIADNGIRCFWKRALSIINRK